MVGAAAVVLVAVLVLFGLQLHSSQADSRKRVTSRFQDRAQVISALTQAIISTLATSSSTAEQYGAPDVTDADMDKATAASHATYTALLDSAGRPIAISRGLTLAVRGNVLTSTAVKAVLHGAPISLSDVHPGGLGGGVIDLALHLETDSGPRVLVTGTPTVAVAGFLGTYLRRVPTRDGTAYVLDRQGTIVGTRDASRPVGRRANEPGLADAAAHGRIGDYGKNGYFVSVPIAGSTWSVVLTSDKSALFSSVIGARKWFPWLVYAALGIVAVAFLLALRRMLGVASELSGANDRLEASNADLESRNELLRHAAELSRSNAELEQFASIASHDLQEPLRKVQTFAAQLQATESENLSEQGQDFLRRMSNAAGRMRALIDDLLTFSRVSTKGRPFTPVVLDDVVAQVLGDLEVAISESGAEVRVGELPTIQADPLQMRQLMQNLLGNALKFRREGVVPKVSMQAHVKAGVAEIVVSDNGLGFEPQYASRIFRAFERLHGASAYPGTGIGLALCRKIVERHHGTITADGAVGHGARFTINLPVEQTSAPETPTSLFPEIPEEEKDKHAVA